MSDITPGQVNEDEDPEADRIFPIVAVGASAGGLEALRDMLAAATTPTDMAFVVVQHMDPTHESMLAQLLDRATTLTVLQCEGGEEIHPERVYIIPPGRGLAIKAGKLHLTDFSQPRGLRRPIDDFFVSLAADRKTNAACVILSGTGADGSTGLRAIKERGGLCIAQQPETARYDGMPTAAIGTSLVDFVKAPGEIVSCLQSFFSRKHAAPEIAPAEQIGDYANALCMALRKAVGHDFSGYKRSTFSRRVERRMHVLGMTSARVYLERVKHDTGECQALFRDLLINVTRFFRDGEMFDILRTRVIEPLLRERSAGQEIRVWIPGCSSGEEAYTVAMIFADAAQDLGVGNSIQVFATDIDEQMLQVAREASYPASALPDIPSVIAERWTTPHGDRFTIAAPVRDLVRFSNHSLVRDPPFSRIDLLCCRNLLIYFDEHLQQQVMPLMHYAIVPEGYLFLGPSETIGRFEHLFSPVDHHARLFMRNNTSAQFPLNLPAHDRRAQSRHLENDEGSGENGRKRRDHSVVQRLAERYAPPAIVLTEDGTVLEAYGKLGRYFDFPVTRMGGSSAFTLARPGLRDVIARLLRQSQATRRRVVARNVQTRTDYGVQPVDVICEPAPGATFLFVLRDAGPFEAEQEPDLDDLDTNADHVDALEDELRITRHKLRASIEELETANEELKSSNEEMMSMNEELQSTNEELSTVNDELKNKVDQLTIANADVRNFFDSTELAVIVVDEDLKIRSYTEAVTTIFPLLGSDRGRLLSDVACKLDDARYLDDALAVGQGEPAIQRRVFTRDGHHTYSLRVLPYRVHNGTVTGATLVFTDISDALSLEQALVAEQERLKVAVDAGRVGIWEYDPKTEVVELDAVHQALLGGQAPLRAPVVDLLSHLLPDDHDALLSGIRGAVTNGDHLEISYRVVLEGGEVRTLKTYAGVIRRDGEHRLLGATVDISPEYRLAESRALMLQEMNHRVKNLFAIIGGMITIAARSHDDVPTFARDLRDRVIALGHAHALSVPSDDQSATDLRSLIEVIVASHLKRASISIDGPRVDVSERYLTPLAMMLHEWTTNAAKYGVLGARAGHLAIQWHRTDTDVILTWVETGPDNVKPSTGSGFGTTLVRSSAQQLGANLVQEIDDTSFGVTLTIPLCRLTP